MEGNKWRSELIDNIQQRNRNETTPFQELLNFHNRLFDEVNHLKTENLNLTLQSKRIRSVSTSEGEPDLSGQTFSHEHILALEQRLQSQQEEINSLHKWKSNNAQQIITLNAKLHDAEKELAAKDYIISENRSLVASLRAEIQMYENNMQELQGLNQDLRDEYQALQIAFSSLQDKLRKTQDENRQLVEKLIKYKSKDADKMNEENETFLKSNNATAFFLSTLGRVSFGRRSDKMKRELDEAAREGGRSSSCSEDRYIDVGILPARCVLKFDAHDGEVNAVKWCPTDQFVATGGTDRKVRLWDVTKVGTYENRGDLVGANQAIMSIDFDSTGSLLVGASNDFASRVWTVSDNKLRDTLTGHSGKVMAAKFLGEASKIITGSHDRTLKIWDLRNRLCTETKFAGSSCNDVVTSDGAGSTIISGHFDKRIRFWDIRIDSSSANDIQLQGKITSLDLSRDSHYLLACVRDDTIQLIDLRRNSIVRSFSHESFKVGCDWTRASFGPGGRNIGVGSADGSILLWSTHTGKLEAVLKDHTPRSSVTAVAFHQQNGMLASVDRGKQITIWADA